MGNKIEFARVKSQDLIGYALDWAVGEAISKEWRELYLDGENWWFGAFAKPWNPSGDWGQCGPLIERYTVETRIDDPTADWAAVAGYGLATGYGPSVLIAICRAIVAMKLGYELDLPANLVVGGGV